MVSPTTTSLRHYRFDDVVIDCQSFSVFKGGQKKALTPRAFDLLRYLIEHGDRVVEKQELFEQVWKEKFVSDNALTRTVKEIRHVLGDSVASPRYIETAHRRGYRFIAETCVLEEREVIYTEEVEGARVVIKEEDREGPEVGGAIVIAAPPTAGAKRLPGGISRHRRALAVLAVSALTLGSLGAYLLLRGGRSRTIDSVAVMPFVNTGGDPELEYLADGLTESVISSLSQLPDLKVMSRNSVFLYKGREIAPQVAGRELGVRAVLIGRVVPRGDHLAISLELVDVEDNRQLWGAQYDRGPGDLPAFQAEVSREISERLWPGRSVEGRQRQLARRHTEDAEAYRLYLRGRFHWNKFTEEGARKAIDYFNRAVSKDPGYARAYAGLAESYVLLGMDYLPPKEAFPVAKVYALKATELDGALPEAHAAMGAVSLLYEWDWPGAEREMKRIIELKPESAEPFSCTLHYLDVTGQPDEAVAEVKRVRELHPTSLSINAEVGCASYYARRYDQAIADLRETLEMDPNYMIAHYNLGRAYGQKGLYEESVAALNRAKGLSENSLFIAAELGYVYAASGKRDETREVLRKLTEESGRRYVDPYLIAIVHAGLGEKDQALVWLDKAFEDRSTWMPWLKVEPKFDGLRSDPRFQDLARRVGLSP